MKSGLKTRTLNIETINTETVKIVENSENAGKTKPCENRQQCDPAQTLFEKLIKWKFKPDPFNCQGKTHLM
ncbi:MAG: hypothetical protein ACHQXK_03280 [Methanosarcina thermophila]|uniref:Uncharacterized protein n=3 Tax=Methanosarcina thermophila TaxID=2210 RepID=A0A0E3NBY5_METTE|nr:hypothetical protein [Methanosarcina thermophila]ALK06419.1 MAG: hypothetical protein AAY43_12985 [Methanosarcina sp. 795]AKB11930.1 hypothetical protein MSTHT_0172 [Methanosarcina thermophila TM-1]AKB14873.1 hypothetical protein MSTHC_0555 [Methanosarcina thermophila CHTI-55]NLU55931.1 hypothetical protein [Methanosarcina thermophila]BAW29572.1 conserved hypothetical protein [Methanosarcina thermophila]